MAEPLTLVRFFHPEVGRRIGVQIDGVIFDVTEPVGTLAAWLQSSCGRVAEAIDELRETALAAAHNYPRAAFGARPTDDQPHLVAPVDLQDVWAAGVTYERSRQARQQEAVDGGDVYARVYKAQRPELFFKARGPWVVGPGAAVGIRSDAKWSVPEPELGLVINPALEIVGVVAGNDMSSRDIEGENPLYLPQAKIYTRSCALGPGIVLQPTTSAWPDVAIHIEIRRGGRQVFAGDTHTRLIRRRPDELVAYLGHSLRFPDGVVLLTGAGVVPPDDFTLAAGDTIRVSIDEVGDLINDVVVV